MRRNKPRLYYITFDVNKSYELEWTAKHLKEHFHLEWILLNLEKPSLFAILQEEGIPVHLIPHRGKRDWLPTFWKLFQLFQGKRDSIVHAHLMDAVLLGLTAAKVKGIPVRIYTRHHASFHHTYHPRAVLYDRYANRIATGIVAISENVRFILEKWEKVPSEKIYSIPHGIDFQEVETVSEERISRIRNKYQIDGFPVIGVISRFIHWKGIQYVLPAFESLLKKYPRAMLILANAVGSYEPEIRKKLSSFHPSSYRVILFEEDVFALYKTFDVFVHVPIDPHIEAFGQTYIEAMALGVPMVCTFSGVAHELVIGGKNAIVVPYQNSEAIRIGIEYLLENPHVREAIVAHARRDVQAYSFQRKLERLLSMYEDQLNKAGRD